MQISSPPRSAPGGSPAPGPPPCPAEGEEGRDGGTGDRQAKIPQMTEGQCQLSGHIVITEAVITITEDVLKVEAISTVSFIWASLISGAIIKVHMNMYVPVPDQGCHAVHVPCECQPQYSHEWPVYMPTVNRET